MPEENIPNSPPGGGEPNPNPSSPGGDSPPSGGDPSPPANPFAMDGMPETWRTDLLSVAGYSDEEAAGYEAHMNRYADVGALVKAGLNAQDKIRAGEVSNGLPDDPSDEQLAAWREANGVPDTAENYQLDLGQGVTLDSLDRDLIDPVLAAAHENNISSSAASAIVSAYVQAQAAQEEQRNTDDNLQAQQATAALRQAFGPDYDTNMTMAQNLVGELPPDAKDVFMNARASDGRALFNIPEVVSWLASTARSVNPVSAVVPINDPNPTLTLSKEIEAIEAKMGGPEYTDADSARYMQLVDARDKYNSQQQSAAGGNR